MAAAAISGKAALTGEIWVVDLLRGVRTRLASGAWYHHYPVWAPSGNRVAYASQKTGSMEIYTSAADGSGEATPLYLSGKDTELYDWSRDGRYLAFWEAGISTQEVECVLDQVDEKNEKNDAPNRLCRRGVQLHEPPQRDRQESVDNSGFRSRTPAAGGGVPAPEEGVQKRNEQDERERVQSSESDHGRDSHGKRSNVRTQI